MQSITNEISRLSLKNVRLIKKAFSCDFLKVGFVTNYAIFVPPYDISLQIFAILSELNRRLMLASTLSLYGFINPKLHWGWGRGGANIAIQRKVPSSYHINTALRKEKRKKLPNKTKTMAKNAPPQ